MCRHSVFQAPSGSIAEISAETPKRAYTTIGLYKGNIVAIKSLKKKSVDLTRSVRKELKQIREVRHENLIPFIGACVDHGNVAILTAYCARGSLEDVLANEDLHLDAMFVSSLVTDILKVCRNNCGIVCLVNVLDCFLQLCFFFLFDCNFDKNI